MFMHAAFEESHVKTREFLKRHEIFTSCLQRNGMGKYYVQHLRRFQSIVKHGSFHRVVYS